MGFLDSLKAWLSRETTELKDVTSDLTDRLDRDLTERERRLDESPTDAMERLQREIDANQGAFDGIEDRVAAAGATADAHASFATEEAGDAAADDILDLDSEELDVDDR